MRRRSNDDPLDQEDWSTPPGKLEALGAAASAVLHAVVEILAALIVTTLLTIAPPLGVFFLMKDHPVHRGVLYLASIWLFVGSIAFLLLAARWVHLLADRTADAFGALARVYGFDSRPQPPRDPPTPQRNPDDIL